LASYYLRATASGTASDAEAVAETGPRDGHDNDER